MFQFGGHPIEEALDIGWPPDRKELWFYCLRLFLVKERDLEETKIRFGFKRLKGRKG